MCIKACECVHERERDSVCVYEIVVVCTNEIVFVCMREWLCV